MSKKIAAGANKIVIDVTCGSGAFMKNKEDADKLASIMTRIGELSGRQVVCVQTNMDEPIGHAVGNALEIFEVVDILKGRYLQEDIKHIICELGANILILANKVNSIEEGKQKILENISNGQAYDKFIQLVANQGGDTSYI